MTGDLRPYPEYKDSGLPWLGRVPAHWDVMRCKYLFREVDERSKTGEETHLSMSQQHGLIPSKDLDGRRLHSESYVGAKLCQTNDLVLNRLKAHLGVFAHARQPGLVSPDYTVLRPVHSDDVVYFEHVFKTPPCVAELRCSTKGIVEGFWRLYTDDFYNIRVPVPPETERTAILSFVRALDAKVRRFIRNRRRLIEVLNEQKQAIINRAVTRGLDPNAPLKPSSIDWLGDIPEHWQTRRLRHVVRSPIKNGVGESAQQYRDDWPRYIRITDIAGPTRLRSDTLASLPPEIAENAVVEPGDLLFAAVGATFGKVYHHRHVTSPSCFAGYLVRVAPDESISGDYLCYWAQSRFYWSQVRSQVIQATIQNFSASRYRDLWLPLPPLDEQQAIVSHLQAELASLDGMIVTAEKAIDLIREYRTRLIADVVTGKVDVRGLAPAEPPLDDEQIDEGIDDEEMLGDDEPELVEEAADADD
jgi:type I restriction enzyme S subunit